MKCYVDTLYLVAYYVNLTWLDWFNDMVSAVGI